MKTIHEWLSLRQQQEDLLLNADGRLKGMSPATPTRRDSAVNTSLSKKPRPPHSGEPVFKPWKPAQPVKLQPFKPAQPAKIVMQKSALQKYGQVKPLQLPIATLDIGI
jgi:hypothetical protein